MHAYMQGNALTAADTIKTKARVCAAAPESGQRNRSSYACKLSNLDTCRAYPFCCASWEVGQDHGEGANKHPWQLINNGQLLKDCDWVLE